MKRPTRSRSSISIWTLMFFLAAFFVFAQKDIEQDQVKDEVPWEKLNTSPNPTPPEAESEEFQETLQGKSRVNGDYKVDKEEEPQSTKPLESKRKRY